MTGIGRKDRNRQMPHCLADKGITLKTVAKAGTLITAACKKVQRKKDNNSLPLENRPMESREWLLRILKE